MIEMDEKTQIATVWFVDCGRCDLMAYLLRQPGQPWRAIYRFRYYADDKAFDSTDRKSWHGFSAKPEITGDLEAEVVRKMSEVLDQVAVLTALRYESRVERVEIGGNVDRLMERLRGRPWFHAKLEGAPDA